MEKKSLFNRWFGFGKSAEAIKPMNPENKTNDPEIIRSGPATAQAHYTTSLTLSGFTAQHFDGEKNLGELGPIKEYFLAYDRLRVRSWQSLLESEISMFVIKKYLNWIVGNGLKVQSNPILQVLGGSKINLDGEAFNEVAETRFGVWASSPKSTYNGIRNLNHLAKEAYKNALVGGDCLVVLRFDGKWITVQLYDGCHVQSEQYGNDWMPRTLDNGNIEKNGIEMTPAGEHVRYTIRLQDGSFRKIEAKVAGMKMAFMVYGSDYRIDNSRGMPLLSVILETLKKLERYKEATIGSAEERQKIVYQIKHGVSSSGESPFMGKIAQALNADGPSEQLPETVDGQKLADHVTATTSKQTINMPIDAELASLESKNELYFKDFYMVNIDLVCAAIGIPPEVALSKYNSNYSASRAAIKDWEHTIKVAREDFSSQFYQPIYDLFLHVNILSGYIQAPGYIQAFMQQDEIALTAYRSAKFVGPSVPHIDPKKEVDAIRAALGPMGAMLPLTSLENAVEALNTGDSDSNMRQFAEEYKEGVRLGIIKEQKPNEKKPGSGNGGGEVAKPN